MPNGRGRRIAPAPGHFTKTTRAAPHTGGGHKPRRSGGHRPARTISAAPSLDTDNGMRSIRETRSSNAALEGLVAMLGVRLGAWLQRRRQAAPSAPWPYERPPVPDTLRRAVWVRDGGLCVVCHKPGMAGNLLVLDHWYPYHLGGPTTMENLRLLHARANEIKSGAWPWTDSPAYCGTA